MNFPMATLTVPTTLTTPTSPTRPTTPPTRRTKACPMSTAIPPVDDVVAHTLLNCLLRELSLPEGQADVVGDHLVVRLPRADQVLRVRLRRQSRTGAHRFTGPAQVPEGADGRGWRAISSAALLKLLEDELGLRSGRPNDELCEQVCSSAQAMQALRASRPAEADAPAGGPTEIWLASEQALVHGHQPPGWPTPPRSAPGSSCTGWRLPRKCCASERRAVDKSCWVASPVRRTAGPCCLSTPANGSGCAQIR
jgi:hypothetical protein